MSAVMDEDRKAAYQEAAIELGKGIALGAVPFLGQAIDAYDTIESAIALYNAKETEATENAQFDLLLAIVGWVPGPGDGVKKSLRIVNKNPERYAPVLFDLLRFVLKECGIETSPEALLDGIFNAGQLKAQLGEIRKGVEDAEAYKVLPRWLQSAVSTTLSQAERTMPAMVGIVQKRLTKWKKLQRNSSAAELPQGRAKQAPPRAKDTQVAKQGEARPASGHANGSVNGQIARQALADITNEMVGISGEHIADYICAYTFGWGQDWKGHDDGGAGQWTKGKPNAEKPGKLSKGGSPKSTHVLYKLADGANGVGIDAVWRANGRNGGKPYAIVEAKATRDEDAPKFLRKPSNTRKPSITSTLGANAIADPSELLEPLEDVPAAAGKSGGGKAGGKAGGKTPAAAGQQPKSSTKASAVPPSGRRDVLVQMSHEWIDANLTKAVAGLRNDILLKGYSRHLFFSPAYHPSGAAHMKAKLAGLPASEHEAHDAFHYDENEVRQAVNRRKAALRKKFGSLPSLKDER